MRQLTQDSLVQPWGLFVHKRGKI